MKKFELWLDESGDFRDKTSTSHPMSLVGGVLIAEKYARSGDWQKILHRPDFNHATEMSYRDKVEYAFDCMEDLVQEYKAIPVFFENKEKEGSGDNRKLYLDILMEGLLQLLQKLDAMYNGVQLDVTIATRKADANKGRQMTHIEEEEYSAAIQRGVQYRRQKKGGLLSKHTRVNMTFIQAKKSKKLIFADFFCNTRYHYCLDKKYFNKNVKRVEEIFFSAYTFSLTENILANRISQMSSRNDLSDALMEIFYVYAKGREEYIDMLLSRMELVSYRSLKSQIKQAATDITAYANQQDSYEKGIDFLQSIQKEFLAKVKTRNFGGVVDPFEFNLLLQLSDMCLRAGRLVEAMRTLAKCRKVQAGMGNYLKEVMTYYQLLEKEAVFAIDAFHYPAAEKLMEDACLVFKQVMAGITGSEITKHRFPDMQSEYYGDALCMQIYAMIFRFQDKTQTQMYEKLVALSDEALDQYPKIEGELERHRQYRSRIEAKAGKYGAALHWLIQASLYHRWQGEDEIGEALLEEFFDKVYQEGEAVSSQFYVMYYVLIMNGARQVDRPLADKMYRALIRHQGIIELTKLHIDSNPYDKEISRLKNNMENILYHPMEIVLWAMAEYCYFRGQEEDNKLKVAEDFLEKNKIKKSKSDYWQAAQNYYNRAIKVCQDSPQNLNLRVIGLAIEACAFKSYASLRKPYNDLYAGLCQGADQVLNQVQAMRQEFQALNLDSPEMAANLACTEDLVTEIRQKILDSKNKDGKISSRALAELEGYLKF